MNKPLLVCPDCQSLDVIIYGSRNPNEPEDTWTEYDGMDPFCNTCDDEKRKLSEVTCTPGPVRVGEPTWIEHEGGGTRYIPIETYEGSVIALVVADEDDPECAMNALKIINAWRKEE